MLEVVGGLRDPVAQPSPFTIRKKNKAQRVREVQGHPCLPVSVPLIPLHSDAPNYSCIPIHFFNVPDHIKQICRTIGTELSFKMRTDCGKWSM